MPAMYLVLFCDWNKKGMIKLSSSSANKVLVDSSNNKKNNNNNSHRMPDTVNALCISYINSFEEKVGIFNN